MNPVVIAVALMLVATEERINNVTGASLALTVALNGLTALNDQVYETSISSGSFYLWDAGEGPTGTIAGFAREESTTDLAAELTSLIQTQRAYSSNAKVIQTVDEMLQETTNIKR